MRRESAIIIRHGRSQHNVGLTDSLDSPLTDFGVEQAKVVGRYLGSGAMGDLSGHVFHVSPFLRTLMTACNIREAGGEMLQEATFLVDKNVAEYFDPKNPDVVVPNRRNDFPHFDWSCHLNEHPADYIHKGEIPEHFLRRVQKAHDELSDKTVVVSHGMTCLALAYELTGPLQHLPIWDHSINNCSITWVENGRKKWHGRNLHHEYDYQDHENFKI